MTKIVKKIKQNQNSTGISFPKSHKSIKPLHIKEWKVLYRYKQQRIYEIKR